MPSDCCCWRPWYNCFYQKTLTIPVIDRHPIIRTFFCSLLTIWDVPPTILDSEVKFCADEIAKSKAYISREDERRKHGKVFSLSYLAYGVWYDNQEKIQQWTERSAGVNRVFVVGWWWTNKQKMNRNRDECGKAFLSKLSFGAFDDVLHTQLITRGISALDQ